MASPSTPTVSAVDSKTPTLSICAVCSAACTKSCASCHSVYYCGRQHQRQHWKQHKSQCSFLSQPTPGAPAVSRASTAQEATRSFLPNNSVPDAWMQGLSEAKQHEWLVDCYRMRLDDDYAWGGCNLHGIYDPDATKLSVMCDFLEFLILATRKRVLTLPSLARWTALLSTAAQLVPYAFEKDDAAKKWGSENVFNVVTGGRSLRYTGELVYGSSIMAGSEQDPIHSEVHEAVTTALMDQDEDATPAFEANRGLFESVGGVSAWMNFYQQLRLSR